MAAYETWFAAAGEAGARELAALRLLGFFDRPASPEDLAALRAAPPISGLTEALFTGSAGVRPTGTWKSPKEAGAEGRPPASAPGTVGVLGFARRLLRSLQHREPPGGGMPAGSRRSQADPNLGPIWDTQWRIVLKRLEDAGLIAPPGPDGGLDAHPLVREHLAATLRERRPRAWREGHRRLYERLKGLVPHRPEGAWPACSPSTRPSPTAAWRGCGRKYWVRSTSTEFCAAGRARTITA